VKSQPTKIILEEDLKFTAKQRGAVVIAGVLKGQMEEAKTIGADQLVATDDESAIANLSMLDVVADTVTGKTAERLIAKLMPGGVFASVLGAPRNAEKYPTVKGGTGVRDT
jgi:NADPH:quinone reductase-like Zn-dependent oxidoreductase